MKKFILQLLFLIFFFSACFCPKKSHTSHTGKLSLEDIAKSKFHNKYKIVYNGTKEFALVTKRYKKLTEPIPNLMFFVVSKADMKQVFSDTLIAGDVYWLNKYVIRATEREQKAESSRRIYTYDIKLKEFILD